MDQLFSGNCTASARKANVFALHSEGEVKKSRCAAWQRVSEGFRTGGWDWGGDVSLATVMSALMEAAKSHPPLPAGFDAFCSRRHRQFSPRFAWTASTKGKDDDGKPYAPVPLPAACGAGPHQFLHNGTRLVRLPPSLLDTTFPPLVSAYCCLPQTCTQVICWPKRLTHTFLCARNLKCNACRQHAHRGLNSFQSRLTVLVTLADQSRYHLPIYPTQCSHRTLLVPP